MSFASWAVAAGLAVALTVSSPFARAEPTPSLPAPPEAGTESPGDTVRTLTSQGYDVKIQWTAGQPSDIPLSECTVTNIDVQASPLAYVMVNSPADGSQ